MYVCISVVLFWYSLLSGHIERKHQNCPELLNVCSVYSVDIRGVKETVYASERLRSGDSARHSQSECNHAALCSYLCSHPFMLIFQSVKRIQATDMLSYKQSRVKGPVDTALLRYTPTLIHKHLCIVSLA